MVFDAHWGIIPGMRPFLRLLFGPPDSPIDRRIYLILGASLMAFKYAVDAAVIAIAAGVFWTPADYLLPMITLNSSKAARFTPGLSIWLLLWTLPFIWIGVVLSVRRALDARIFPGVVVAFFVPFLNYLLMAALAIAPTSVAPPVRPAEPQPLATPDPASPASHARSSQLGVVAGQVSAAVTLESRDSSGNASPVATDTPTTLSALPSMFV